MDYKEEEVEMIVSKSVVAGIFVLVLLFTSLFITITGISEIPDRLLESDENITVISQYGDPNPIKSSLSIEIVDGLKTFDFVEIMSPEIFVFTTLKDQAVVVRGVNMDDFLEIENIDSIEGEIPQNDVSAMIGSQLAKRLNINIGEPIQLFGSFSPSIAFFNITGIFTTNKLVNDELIVPLNVARTLAGMKKDTISVIRVKTSDNEKLQQILNHDTPKFVITDLYFPANIYLYDTTQLSFNVNNWGAVGGTAKIQIDFVLINSTEYNFTSDMVPQLSSYFEIDMDAEEEQRKTIDLTPQWEGIYVLNVSVDNDIFPYHCNTTVDVSTKPIYLDIQTIIEANNTEEFTINTLNEEPLNNAEVIFKNEHYYTDPYGRFYLFFEDAGIYQILITKKGYETKKFNITVQKEVPYYELFEIKEPQEVCGKYFLKQGVDILLEIKNNTVMNYTINGGIFNISDSTISTDEWQKGVYGIEFKATDGFNYSITTKYFYIDDTPPSKEIPITNNSKIRPGEHIYIKIWDGPYSTNVSCKITVSNNTYILEKEKNGSDPIFLYFNDTLNLSGLYNFYMIINDSAGNSVENLYIINVTDVNDITPPEIEIIYPNSTSRDIWSGEKLIIKATDNFRVSSLKVKVYHNGTLMKPDQYDENFTDIRKISINANTTYGYLYTTYYWPEGNYTLEIFAEDPYGNVNTTTLIITIDNTDEEIPPRIDISNEVNVIGRGDYIKVSVFDNIAIYRTGYSYDETEIEFFGESVFYIDTKNISFQEGTITIFAEDINGNTASKDWYLKLIDIYYPEPIISLDVEVEPLIITDLESTYVYVKIENSGDATGYASLHISIDNETYIEELYILVYESTIQERNYEFDFLEIGHHEIIVNDISVNITVKDSSMSNIPITKVLKYAKNVAFEVEGAVVYKALEISKGNFAVILISIIGCGAILTSIGMISLLSKSYSMKEKNIGILRALGASNKYLRKLFLKETLKYSSLGISLGIVGGFIAVMIITDLQMLRAFGHVLSTPLNIDDVIFIATLSFSLAIISAILISGKFIKKGVTDIMIKKETEKEDVTLEEVIGK